MSVLLIVGCVVFLVIFLIAGPKFLVRSKLPAGHEQILQKDFAYYRGLSENKKRRFRRKLNYFMVNKDFVPMKMNEVTDEMRVLISATAVQLTFGLRTLKLPIFPKILVFPTKFRNKVTGQVHIGEVNSRGIIALSWEDFKKGFANETDGRNVGLHELAHAMQFEDAVENEEHGFLRVEQLKKINMYYEIEKLNAKNGEQAFFRNYALTNAAEFFAVGVEYFFEKSAEFKIARPELYTVYAKLLNQDPVKLQSPS